MNCRQDLLIAATYEKWYDAVLGYVRKRIGREREADAEDIVQDVFLQILSSDTFLQGESLVRLVYKVARNQVIDFLRHHACTEAARAYFQEYAPRATRCTEEQIAANDLERLEEECIARMPGRKAQVFILYLHEGHTVKDISEELSLSRRTVENHIFRARTEIRKYINKAS